MKKLLLCLCLVGILTTTVQAQTTTLDSTSTEVAQVLDKLGTRTLDNFEKLCGMIGTTMEQGWPQVVKYVTLQYTIIVTILACFLLLSLIGWGYCLNRGTKNQWKKDSHTIPVFLTSTVVVIFLIAFFVYLYELILVYTVPNIATLHYLVDMAK